jgi:hypothetical protein
MQIQLSSNNSFSRIYKLVQQEGFHRGVLDSLNLVMKLADKEYTGVLLKNMLGAQSF